MKTILSTLLVSVLASAPLTVPAAAQEHPFPYVLRHRDVAFVGGGLGLSVLGDLVTNGADPLTRDQIAAFAPEDVNGFDRTATRNWSPTWGDRSDWGRDALVAGAVLMTFAPQTRDVLNGRWREATTLGTMFVESYLLLRGATYTAKGLAGRARPFVHNTSLSVDERLAISDADPQDARQSFYSGHAAAAFALASLMSKIYTDIHGRSRTSDILWAASLSVASFTAYSRVKAGMHYPSDVLVGAGVGTAIGLGVPWLHRADAGAPVEVGGGAFMVAVRIPR